tara:strand:- start:3659 stop:4228 length:570 start_codon:yes stop_codon:yes gene_type:complete
MSKNDSKLAEQIISKDEELDQLETQIDDVVIKTIALRQPVADDLRLLFAAIKISAAFERIGDLTKNIGKRTLSISDEEPLKLRAPISELGKQVNLQLTKAVNSHATRDSKLALEVWNSDIEIDKIYNSLTKDLVAALRKKKQVEVGSHLLFIAKNLERIGDHTTEIAEMVYYVITGEQMDKSARPKKSF